MAINIHISGPELPTDSKPMAEMFVHQMLNNTGLFGIDCSTGIEYSYPQFKKDVFTMASVFTKTNIGRGDIVMVLDYCSYPGQVVLLAGHLVGAVMAPLCNRLKKDSFEKKIDQYKPDVLFCNTPIKMDEIESCLSRIAHPPKLKISIAPCDGFTAYSSIVASDGGGGGSFVPPPVKPAEKNHPCVILNSSGSTGIPKPIMISHDAIKNCSTIRSWAFIDESIVNRIMTTTFLSASPGFKSFMRATQLGILRLFFSSEPTAEHVLYSIDKYKPTALITKGSFAYEMMTIQTINSRKYDINSLCTFIVGGFTMRSELQNIITTNLLQDRIPLMQRYGTIEMGTIAQWPLRSDINSIRFGFVGRPAHGVKIKIVSLKTGESVGPNTEGEIRTKTTSSMIGYAYDLKRTIKSYDEDGWFKTGDIGYYTDDCCLYVVSRIKDVMWYNGRRAAPIDIETVLLSHSAVLDAGVTYKEGLLGDLFVGVVKVTEKGPNIRPDQILSYVNDKVEDHQRLRGGVVFVDDLPKTACGKLNRVKLRNMVCCSSASSPSSNGLV